MRLSTIIFIAIMAALVLGTFYVSYTGAMLPGPEQAGSVSLKNVKTRRTHFMRYYALGK